MDKSIILPSKPRVISEEKTTGVYEIDGFYPGYGHTFGNALRRILLSSLPGAAPTEVKIETVKHMFSTIDGVKEDVVAILLNLKQLRIKIHSDEPQKLSLSIKGAKEVTAKNFKVPTQVEIANPDLVIATLTDKESTLSMEVTVEKGLGYRPHDSAQQKKKMDIGIMMLDAVFTPIRRVRYEVENMRVGDRTDFNRLRVIIETDGTLTPREALEKAITIMIEQLKAIIGFVEEEVPVEEEKIESKEDVDKDDGGDQGGDFSDVLKVRIEELNFSGRVLNALAHAGIRTVGGLVKKTPEDLMKLEGIGGKAVEDIKQVLSGMGLALRE